MDLSDINKVASRKRMSTDAVQLREKVSRETAKVIKLKVAQDTAYWDLKERLQQLEGAHERLQQNMVDVQMQHEAASAHYARELEFRPDTLNKLGATRDMCNVLEEYGARLQRSVARCRGDGAALGTAYAQCGARVRLLTHELAKARADAAHQHATAERANERAAADAQRLGDALQQLGEARACAREQQAAREELVARLARSSARLTKADEAHVAMRDDVTRLLQQFEVQSAEMKQTIARQGTEAAEGARALEALRVQERELSAEFHRLQEQQVELRNTIDNLKKEEAAHINEIKNLEIILGEKNKHEKDMELEISSMKQELSTLGAEKLEVIEQLKKSIQECSNKCRAIEELKATTAQLTDELGEARTTLDTQRDADAKKIEELRSALAAKERELEANSSSIACFMNDLKAEADARLRADASLGAARRQAEAEREAARATEKALRDTATRLDAAVKDKDDELSKQMKIILDTRSEKEQLQKRIQVMQNTIDDIQHLTGRPQTPNNRLAAKDVGEPPELDVGPKRPEPRRVDDLLYDFSDDSMENDRPDAQAVARRFEELKRAGAFSKAPHRRQTQGSTSLPQVKDDLNIKSRAFFKTKRSDRTKKLK